MARHRLPSDLGGTRLGQPIDRNEHRLVGWRLLCEAVRGLMLRNGLWQRDVGRRATEELGDLYEQLDYHQRRVLTMEAVLVEKGLLDPADVPPRPPGAPPLKRHATPPGEPPEDRAGKPPPHPAFAAGDRVRIRDDWPPGHIRTPAYVRGKPGRVVGVHGPYPNPETIAYGGSGLPAQWLYTVEFTQASLWDDYRGRPGDAVLVDVYGHWIQPAEDAP